MELTTAMLADGAQQFPPGVGKLYILGGQWDRLLVPTFPAQHPTLAVVLVMKVEYGEALDPHRVEVELMLDGRSVGAKASGQMITGHAPGLARGAASFVALPITFNNLVLETPGRHEWIISVDDAELGRLPMEVVQGAMPGMPVPMPDAP
jgi:hypothetical protein